MDEQDLPNPLDVPQALYELSRASDAAMADDLAEGERRSWGELRAFQAVEEREGRRLHKGHALYNLAVVAFGRSPAEARFLFLGAFIEDVRTWVRRRPAGAHAGRVLFQLYHVPRQTLAALAKSARATSADPLQLASRWAERVPVPEALISIPPVGSRDDRQVLAEPSLNIFIGGNYSECIDRIYDVREVITNDTPLRPVIVREFTNRPGESIRIKSLRLLDACPWVIFEGSRPGGWDFELEHLARTRPNTPTLVTYSADQLGKPHPASMAPSTDQMPRLEKLPYGTSGDRRYAVLQWLLRAGAIGGRPLTERQSWMQGSNTLIRPSGSHVVPEAPPGGATPTTPLPESVESVERVAPDPSHPDRLADGSS